MQKIVRAMGGAVDGLNRFGILIAELGLLALMVLTVYAVLARYVFERPSIHAFEISAYLLVLVTWACAGWVLKVDRHVSMEALNQRLTGRRQAISDAIGHAMVLVFSAILVWVGTASVIEAFGQNYRSASLLAFPLWAVYALIPIGAAVLGLTAIQKLSGAVRRAVGDAGGQK